MNRNTKKIAAGIFAAFFGISSVGCGGRLAHTVADEVSNAAEESDAYDDYGDFDAYDDFEEEDTGASEKSKDTDNSDEQADADEQEGAEVTEDTDAQKDAEGTEYGVSGEGVKYEKDFGSYIVPEGWEESKTYSTNNKFFYVENGHDNDSMPDNISVNVGTNKYTVEEAIEFGRAILSQLAAQTNGSEQINASGSNTEQDYPVLTFVIGEESDGCVTTQYYVLADNKYCLIHLTNYSCSEETEAVARKIVDSFVWAE